jgi:hypothetical protein
MPSDDPGVHFPGEILVSSRSFTEYCEHFAVGEDELLSGKILDCPGGATDFGSSVRELGGFAVSADPRYEMSPPEFESLIGRESLRVSEWVHRQPDRFGMTPGAPWPLEGRWREAADRFLADYRQCRTAGTGHYVSASLPVLPFPDREFTLVLSGFLLFSYGERFDFTFHLEAVRELLRVCQGQVRLHPLNESSGRPYPHLEKLLGALADEGVASQLIRVTSSSDVRDDKTLILTPQSVKPRVSWTVG